MDRHVRIYHLWLDAEKMGKGDWPSLPDTHKVIDAKVLTDEGPTYTWRLTILVDPA